MMSIIYTFFNEHGLSEQQNDCAKRYYSEGLTKPNQILKAFEYSSLSTPLKSKIVNFLAHNKIELYGKIQISLGNLSLWCENHSERPIEIDMSFVFCHNFQMVKFT